MHIIPIHDIIYTIQTARRSVIRRDAAVARLVRRRLRWAVIRKKKQKKKMETFQQQK